MKKQHLQLIAWLLLLTVFLSACSLEKPIIYSYTEEYLRISEPYGADFIFQENVCRTSVGGRTYEFQSSIPENQRTMFISAQEELCELLENNGISTAGQTYRVLAHYRNWTDSANHVSYYGLNTTQSWEQALTTVQAALGDYTNYGYLYALSNKIAADLRWKQDEISTSASAEALSQNGRLLNLVYPCFDKQYTDAADIDACKLLAKELLSGMDHIWSEEAFLQARLDYAQSKSLDFQPTYLTFAYYSASCPLKIQTKYLEIFRDQSFQASSEYLNRLIEQDYMVDTGSVIHAFEWLDEQLTNIRKNFASVEMVEDFVVPVRLTARVPGDFETTPRSGGFFYTNQGENTIYATTVTVLARTYTQYLFWLCGGMNQSTYEFWYASAVAFYYTMPGSFEYRRLQASHGLGASVETIEEELIGQAFDEPMDEVRFIRSVLRSDTVQYLYYLKEGGNTGAAFGEYFVRTYGNEAFLRCMIDTFNAKRITGKTLDEILDDWIADMQDASKDELVGQVA